MPKVLIDYTKEVAGMSDSEKRRHMDTNHEVIYEVQIGNIFVQLIIFDQAENGYEGFSYTRYVYLDGLNEGWSFEYNESWDSLDIALKDTNKLIKEFEKRIEKVRRGYARKAR